MACPGSSFHQALLRLRPDVAGPVNGGTTALEDEGVEGASFSPIPPEVIHTAVPCRGVGTRAGPEPLFRTLSTRCAQVAHAFCQ